MQRSSQSIASLAAALAKAQAELINPEKSLVATIRSEAGETEQTFRYAPLSSGLDIVRKILGQHEIATLQTTSIDQPAGTVNLTTVLAHSSGEWIASDWPVCAISDTAAPHRMGAALTYARRYALFTLVGIAGEDDLDAPDLNAPTAPAAGAEKPVTKKLGRLNSGREHPPQRVRADGGANAAASGQSKPILGPEASAALRDQLAVELKDLNSADEAANWAHRVLGAKNSLGAADAACIEQAFQARLSLFATTNEPQIPREAELTQRGKKRRRSAAIDKTVLALPASRRTGSMSSRLPSRLASSAAGVLQMLTICASRNHWPLGARSAMSSPCRSVGAIIARSIALAMRPHGGTRPVSIRPLPLARYGCKHIHYRQFRIKSPAKARSPESQQRSEKRQG